MGKKHKEKEDFYLHKAKLHLISKYEFSEIHPDLLILLIVGPELMINFPMYNHF